MSVPATRTSNYDGLPEQPTVGLGTKTGLSGAVLAGVLALIDAIAGGAIDADTRMLIGVSAASAIATVLSRGYQQGKLYLAKRGLV